MAEALRIRAIVGRFSFDFSRQAIERAFQKYPFEFCAHITSHESLQPFAGLSHDSQELFDSGAVRNAHYADVDFDIIPPLDEDFILQMSECESVFMAILSRLEWKQRISYQTRRLWYLRHLQFWNHYIQQQRINLYLSAWIPHEIPDIIIYYLCKLHGIPVVYFNTTEVRDTSFVEYDIRESALQLQQRYEELLAFHEHKPQQSLPLSENFASYERGLTNAQGEAPPIESVSLPTYWKTICTLLHERPLRLCTFAARYLWPSGWRRFSHSLYRWYTVRQTERFYAAHVQIPDLKQHFIYFPLHFQPEATTVPMGGVFADLILAARILNAALPDDMLIYVKEHPRRSNWVLRNIQFYDEFRALSKVRFVPQNYDTFVLREHCKAVATVTGSAGFEAIFRGKPVLLFGSRYYQYARGVFPVRSLQDCTDALCSIFSKRDLPTKWTSHLFLKAMEDTCVHAVLDPWSLQISNLPAHVHSQAMGDAIIVELRRFFSSQRA